MQAAEALIMSLKGVVSARLSCRPGGEVDEIHVLTTRAVSPKQTVRNIESALRARFDLTIDHRKISIAQSSDEELAGWDPADSAKPPAPVSKKPSVHLEAVPGGREAEGSEVAASVGRLRLMGHKVHREGGHRLRTTVELAWQGQAYPGESVGPDLPRQKLEGLARATLKAMGKVLGAWANGDDDDAPSLDLDGVKVVEAFDRSYVLVAVHALHSRGIIPLSGSAPVDDGVERAVVQATLQAADRWVRGQL